MQSVGRWVAHHKVIMAAVAVVVVAVIAVVVIAVTHHHEGCYNPQTKQWTGCPRRDG